jgi:hypothetical protein
MVDASDIFEHHLLALGERPPLHGLHGDDAAHLLVQPNLGDALKRKKELKAMNGCASG